MENRTFAQKISYVAISNKLKQSLGPP